MGHGVIRLLGAALLRSFSIQGSWSLDRLQGIGFAVSIEPLLRLLPGGRNGIRYRAALGRATGYFNAHPFLAGLAVGAVARADRDDLPQPQVDRLRAALKGPLGALGDRLVWAGVLPLASAAGILGVAAGGR